MQLLYNHFKQSSYIGDNLAVKSGRYVAIWKDAKPKTTNEYRSHGLLPLNVLDYDEYGVTRSCVGCERNLPKGAYSNSAWKGVSRKQCLVCRAISVRQNQRERAERHDDDWEDDFDDSYLMGYYSD
jgi:exonuclease 3'-5' domain-containing protein 1